jgi:hypothetical protein
VEVRTKNIFNWFVTDFKLILACQGVLNDLLFFQIHTLPQSMHHKREIIDFVCKKTNGRS